MPLWMKDVVADDQVQRLVWRVTSVLPGLSKTGDASTRLAASTPVPSDGPTASMEAAAGLNGTTAGAEMPPSKQSRKRSSSTEHARSSAKPVKQRCLPAEVVHEEPDQIGPIGGAAKHQANLTALLNVSTLAPRQDEAPIVSEPLVPALQHGGLNDAVSWDHEPDWLAAHDPTQHLPTQFNSTQPCFFEALLATKSVKTLPPATAERPARQSIPAQQLALSQADAASHLISGESSAARAVDMMPIGGVPSREVGSAAPPAPLAATPIFRRRRKRSGTSAPSESAADRSSNHAATAVTLPSGWPWGQGGSAAHSTLMPPPPGGPLHDATGKGSGDPSPAHREAECDRSDERPAACRSIAGLQEAAVDDPLNELDARAAAIDPGILETGAPSSTEPLLNITAADVVTSAEQPSVEVNARSSSRSERSKQRPPVSGKAALSTKPARQRRAKGRRRAGAALAMATPAHTHSSRPAAMPVPACQEADAMGAPDAALPQAHEDTSGPILQRAAKKDEVSAGVLADGTEAGNAMQSTLPGAVGGRADRDAVQVTAAAHAAQIAGAACGALMHVCGTAAADIHHDAADDVPQSGEVSAVSRPRRRRRRTNAPADPAFDTSRLDTPPAAAGVLCEAATGAPREQCAPGEVAEEDLLIAATPCEPQGGPDADGAGMGLTVLRECDGEALWQPVPPGDDLPSCPQQQACCEKENVAANVGQIPDPSPAAVECMKQSAVQGPEQQGVDVTSHHPAPALGDAAVHISQPQADACTQGHPERVGAPPSRGPEANDWPELDWKQPLGPCAHGDLGVRLSDAGGSAVSCDVDMCDACTTPLRHTAGGSLGPGFISASELLESQRSGRAPSSGTARSPSEPSVLCFDAVAAPALGESGGAAAGVEASPVIACCDVVPGTQPGFPQDGRGSGMSPHAPVRTDSTGDDAVAAASAHASADDQPRGETVQGSAVLMGHQRQPLAHDGTHCQGDACDDRRPHGVWTAQNEAPHAVDFSQLSDWGALTGPLAGELMDQWRAVLCALPKPPPKHFAAELHAELRGMQRAHATLSRILHKLQAPSPQQPVAVLASQHPTAPADVNQHPLPALQDQEAGAHCSPQPPALKASRGIGAQLLTTQPGYHQILPVSQHVDATAPEAQARGAGLRALSAPSQELRHGWAAEASQAMRHTVAVPHSDTVPCVAVAGPSTPMQRKGHRSAVPSPRCIPDTPSESEGVAGSQPTRSAMPERAQETQGSPGPCSGAVQLLPAPQIEAAAQEAPAVCKKVSDKDGGKHYNTKTVKSWTSRAPAGSDKAGTVLLNGFELVAPPKRGRLSRKTKA
eukprot:jgi/Ulvmu1/8068/UM004_0305.1